MPNSFAPSFAPVALAALLSQLTTVTGAFGSDQVRGKVTQYPSPNTVTEACVALEHMPGGVYSDNDRAGEAALCDLDFYADNVALCPKLRSTSPGTFVYALNSGPYANRQHDFEQEVCPRGELLPKEAEGPPVSFKVTMNERETSATFSTASLLYYHFARYFDATIRVPVAVYRSMDRDEHKRQVTDRGLKWSEGHQSLKMIHAAWQTLSTVEHDPAAYPATGELFTADLQQIYGVLLHVKGKRFGAEINGTRASGWGEGQSRDFQRTAPFLALTSDAPLQQAIATGLQEARHDPAMRKATGEVSNLQMVYWMQGLTEITLLDFIFSQQDRIGNIDYVNTWYRIGDNGVERSEKQPAGDAAVQLRRIALNDNDAGGRTRYANYTRKTQMLEKIRHYHPETFRRLLALHADFGSRGPLYQYLRDSFGLTERQLNGIVDNTGDAVAILRGTCEAGKMRFDLLPEQYLPGATRTDATPANELCPASAAAAAPAPAQ